MGRPAAAAAVARRQHMNIAYDDTGDELPCMTSSDLKNNGLLPSDNLHGCPPDNAAVARDFLPVCFCFCFAFVLFWCLF